MSVVVLGGGRGGRTRRGRSESVVLRHSVFGSAARYLRQALDLEIFRRLQDGLELLLRDVDLALVHEINDSRDVGEWCVFQDHDLVQLVEHHEQVFEVGAACREYNLKKGVIPLVSFLFYHTRIYCFPSIGAKKRTLICVDKNTESPPPSPYYKQRRSSRTSPFCNIDLSIFTQQHDECIGKPFLCYSEVCFTSVGMTRGQDTIFVVVVPAFFCHSHF